MGRKIERHLMKHRLFYNCLAAAALLMSLTACGDKPGANVGTSSDSGKPRVFTVNYPLTYFAERIGGEAIEVVFPAPAEGDPAFWQPTENDIAAFQSADLILRNGADYAKWMQGASLPESVQVDTSATFADSLIVVAGTATHSHGAGGEHSHDGVAFTTWLDLGQAIQQAQAIRDAFVGRWPDQTSAFDANFSALRADLEKLDGDLAFAAQGFGKEPLAASHPVYQYLARRYGLKIRSVLWEPETVPDDAAMADLKALLEKHPAKLMIWEGDPAPDSVAKLDAIGIKSVVFDPCGNRPEASSDFLSVMRENIKRLAAAVPPVSPQP